MKQAKVRFYYHTIAEITVNAPENATDSEILDIAEKQIENEDVDGQLLANIDEAFDPEIIELNHVAADEYGNVIHVGDRVIKDAGNKDYDHLYIFNVIFIAGEVLKCEHAGSGKIVFIPANKTIKIS